MIRRLTLFPLFALAACQVSDTDNGAAVSYDQNVAENAAEDVGNGVEEAANAIVSDTKEAASSAEAGAKEAGASVDNAADSATNGN